MQWHYSNAGNQVGPVSATAFEALVKDGSVQGTTLVWSQSLGDWKPWAAVLPETAVCMASGGRYLQREMVPYEGGFISAEHKDEYFQRIREGINVPGRMVYAGFWIRFVAKFIDGLAVGVVNILVNLGLSFLMLGSVMFQPRAGHGIAPGLLISFQLLTFVLNTGTRLLYEWFFLSRHAATPGKMALGLKVVRSDGSPLSTGRIIGRFFSEFLSALLLCIGYIMAAFDDEKQALHDRICDTRVIKAK